MASVLLLATAVGAAAAPAIKTTVKTKIAVTVTRGADGSLEPKVTLTASDPHCLAAERFPTWADGHYTTAGSVLYFRGSQDYTGSPPNHGWLRPESPFGRSTLTFGDIWAASSPIRYFHKGNVSEPLTGTVAESTGGYVRVYAGSKRFTTDPFKAKYQRAGRRYKVTCAPATALFRF